MRLFCHRLVLLGFVLLVAVLRAQEPPAPDSAHIVIHSNVQEVVLDVVVRHKDQSLATNLKASDFIVTESGVPQTIRSFRLAGGSEAGVIAPPSPLAGASPGAPADLRPGAELHFHRVRSDGRRLQAKRARSRHRIPRSGVSGQYRSHDLQLGPPY